MEADFSWVVDEHEVVLELDERCIFSCVLLQEYARLNVVYRPPVADQRLDRIAWCQLVQFEMVTHRAEIGQNSKMTMMMTMKGRMMTHLASRRRSLECL